MDEETSASLSASVSPPAYDDDGTSSSANVDVADDHDDVTEVVSNVTLRSTFRDNNNNNNNARRTVAPTMTITSTRGGGVSSSGLFANMIRFFNPRATDIHQLLVKLQTQFKMLEVEHKKYWLAQTRSRWDDPKNNSSSQQMQTSKIIISNDPKHPMNNPKLISEVHFVGRKAIDPTIIELSTLLLNHDTYGSIKELWLNDNLISDEGASAIASYLESPSCALVELWLGDNQIGPAGTALLSAALSSNIANTKLMCLGLYNNPIGNGGAMTLAQLLRKNHRLITVDVHGCGRRDTQTKNNNNSRSDDNDDDFMEGYGCKVVKAEDGKEYVARVVAPLSEEDQGQVTDHRLLDAIQTYVAFNRINPTREQVIRGFTDSKKPSSRHRDQGRSHEGVVDEDPNQTSIVTKFLSDLGSRPANEPLTDAEKQVWKDCEWDRLYVEIERARIAKRALTDHLLDVNTDTENETNALLEKEVDMVDQPLHLVDRPDRVRFDRDLDDEVVYTTSRSWRTVKMEITGSTKPSPGQGNEGPSVESAICVENESFIISGDSIDIADGNKQ